MNKILNHLVGELKTLFSNEELSDGMLHIIEGNLQLSPTVKDTPADSSSTPQKAYPVRKRRKTEIVSPKVETSEPTTYCSIPIHCFVLSLQSEYFKAMINNADMLESKTKVLNMKVNVGDGIFLKYLINSFYDHEVFNEMAPYDLLRVLELADCYSCTNIIEQISDFFDSIVNLQLSDCNNIANRIKERNCGLECSVKAQSKLLNRCGKIAAEILCPLETQSMSIHKQFFKLSFTLLHQILKSKSTIAWYESSILVYLELWLRRDLSRVTSENICALLGEIHYFYLSPGFLMDVITEKHELFNVWPQYNNWFINAIGHHAVNRKRNYFRMFEFSHNRDYKCKTEDEAIAYRFIIDNCENENIFNMSENFFTYKGYRLSPRMLAISLNDDSGYSKLCIDFNTSLNITNFFEIEDNFVRDLSKQEVFLNLTLAIAIIGKNNTEGDIEGIFENNPANHCGSVNINYRVFDKLNERVFSIGYIHQRCISKLVDCDIVIVFKDREEDFPRHWIPDHLNNPSKLHIQRL